MIASDQSDPVLVAHFQCQQEQKGLNRMEAAIHEVSHEYIVCLGAVTADLEKLHQIVKLAVDVSAYL